MNDKKLMVISLCADTFSINDVVSAFNEQHPGYQIREYWTRFLVVEDDKGSQYTVSYRVDDETLEPGFEELIKINKTIDELESKDADTVSSKENVTTLETSEKVSSLDKILRLAALTSKRRNRLPDSEFAIPSKRKYPIDTKARARNALARVSQFGTPEEKRMVCSAVKKRYPDIEVSEDLCGSKKKK